MRICPRISSVVLVCVFATGLAPTRMQAQQEAIEKLKSLEAAVAASVIPGQVREFTFCHLRAAWWGRYDVSVRVGRSVTLGNQPLILRITRGEFSQKVDPDTSVDLAETEGKGNVVFANKEEAFARGVPFFITDAAVSPAEVNYTVHSNPAVPVERAFFMMETRSEFFSMTALEAPKPLVSKPEPQARTFKLSKPLDPTSKHRFEIVTELPNHQGCLVSNTIDLNALLKTEPPK